MSAQQRNKIATLSQGELEALAVPELKALCRGVVTGYSRLKKSEIVDALIEATAAERQLAALGVQAQDIEATATADAIRESISVDTGDFVQRIVKQLEGVAVEHWDGQKFGPEIFSAIPAIGAQITSYLDQLPGHDGKAAVTHRLRIRTHIMNGLRDSVEGMEGSIYQNALRSCLQLLEKHVTVALAEATREKKVTGSRNLAERQKASGRAFDFSPLYEWASEIFETIEDRSPRQWKPVAIALLIATGRRPAELLCSDTKLEATGEYALSFTGQLKAKGQAGEFFEAHPSYEIPSLFPAAQVVTAYQWLQATENQSDDPARAHRLHSGNLSKELAKQRILWGYGERKALTCKGLRAIYAKVSHANHRAQSANPQQETAYIAGILGHGRADIMGADTSTPAAYQADFEITEGWEILPTGMMPEPPTTAELREMAVAVLSK
ncbi:MAG: hypothetical protein HC824_11315 [Synechococcales cyanobacterium RM1_1_8]|nr:hypothetical protein [Synechococcales cyanobacterium RM1_1_8]